LNLSGKVRRTGRTNPSSSNTSITRRTSRYGRPMILAAAKAHYCIDYHQSRPECGSLRGNFTALVSSTGQQIQRILDQLDGLEIADNTLVFITSDNGSVFRTDSKTLLPDRSLRGNKDMVFDGACVYPLLSVSPGVFHRA
jgi:arylsulfatase A-like enzyme